MKALIAHDAPEALLAASRRSKSVWTVRESPLIEFSHGGQELCTKISRELSVKFKGRNLINASLEGCARMFRDRLARNGKRARVFAGAFAEAAEASHQILIPGDLV